MSSETTAGANSSVGFEPKIVAFVCNWCTYLGADLAGTNRPPAGVASATAATATCAVNSSERDSAEFDPNTNPPGFCMYLR